MPTIADEIVIRISADLQKFKGEMLAAIGETKNFKREIDGVDKSTQVLNQGLKAFSWTVFAQGALNASTAMAQLYTSVSNLARVQYQLKASMTAVERAEDQVARKTLQLSREMDKHGKSSEKSALLINEIETAYDQLRNKQERVKLAQDQVNDTYVLFGFNLANTLFGIAQTIIGLKSMLAQKALLITATKGVAIAQGDLMKSTLALSGSQGVLLKTTEALTYAYTKNAIAANVMAGSTARAAASGGILSKISGGLIGGLGNMSLKTAGVTFGLGALAYGLGSAAVKMDMVDGKLDGMSARFTHATVEGAKFGRQIELITDMGDPFVNTLNAMGEALSGGMWKAPDLSKFTDETKKKIKEEFGSFGVGVENQQQLDEARLKKQKHDLEVLDFSRKSSVAKALAGGISPTSMNLGLEESQRINSIVQEQFSYRSAIHDIEKRTGKELSSNVDIMNDYLDLQLESGNIKRTELEMFKQQIQGQQKLNDEAEKGNKINGKTLELQQQIMALKKKLSPRFFLEEAIQSASTGEFTRNFISRVLGDKAESMIGYQPFRGVKVGMDVVEANIELMRMDQKMAIIVSEMEQQILAGNPDRVAILRDRLKKLTSGPNITKVETAVRNAGKNQSLGGGAMQAINALKTIANKINYQSAFFKGQTFTTSELSANQLATVSGLGKNTLAAIKAGNLTVIGTGIGRPDAFKNYPLTRARMNRSRSKGGRTEFYQHEVQAMLGAVGGVDQELLDFLGIMNPFTSLGLTIEPIYNEIRSYAEAIGQLRLKSKFDLPSALAKISTNLGAQVESTVSLRYSRIGISTSGQLKEVISNPLTYDDIDNRLRYTDRLAQISTGATIL